MEYMEHGKYEREMVQHWRTCFWTPYRGADRQDNIIERRLVRRKAHERGDVACGSRSRWALTCLAEYEEMWLSMHHQFSVISLLVLNCLSRAAMNPARCKTS